MDLMDSGVKDSRGWAARHLPDHETEALQAELARREAALSSRLQAKAEAEEKAKQERQHKAKAQLKEFIEGWRRGVVQQRKQVATPDDEDVETAERGPAEVWRYVANRVSQKDNAYVAQKNVDRMKAAILNHAAYLEGEGA